MYKKKCIILGAGGHAKVVSSLIALSGKYELISIIDTNSENCNELLFGKPILKISF
jgi:saccharopine dehydrogenase-like NADP-dependent oxidoreductase